MGIKNEFYPTPSSVIEVFLKNYELDPESTILEPCAGNGNIIKALMQNGCGKIKAVELRKEEGQNLDSLVGYGNYAIADFLSINNKFLKAGGGGHGYYKPAIFYGFRIYQEKFRHCG